MSKRIATVKKYASTNCLACLEPCEVPMIVRGASTSSTLIAAGFQQTLNGWTCDVCVAKLPLCTCCGKRHEPNPMPEDSEE